MDNLSDLLVWTDEQDFDTELGFELELLPKFCDILGIDENFLYYDTNIGEGMRPDGLVRTNINIDPWMVIEAKYSPSDRIKDRSLDRLRTYLAVLDAEIGVLIGVGYITVLDSDGEVIFDIDTAESDRIEEVEETLSPPDSFRTGDEPEYSQRVSRSTGESHPYFQIDLQELENALNSVDQAESSQEKGDAFEDFAQLLFGAVPFLTVRNRNLGTNTGEIDLVVEYEGYSELTIFDDFCRYILVECKNWSDSVGVAQVRDFKGKMDKSKIDLGIIFARNGISGDEGANALRWIHDFFQREGRLILVISDNELEQLLEGRSFYNQLDEAIYQRRFDF